MVKLASKRKRRILEIIVVVEMYFLKGCLHLFVICEPVRGSFLHCSSPPSSVSFCLQVPTLTQKQLKQN